MKNQVKISLQGISENVGLARMAAATFAAQGRFTLGEIDEIKVAISEAVSNSIIHGYRDVDGIVDLMMTLYEDKIEFVISDSGCGIADVDAAREPSFSTDPERMGLGFAFMESFMDVLHVDSVPEEGTSVILMKKFTDSATEQVSCDA